MFYLFLTIGFPAAAYAAYAAGRGYSGYAGFGLPYPTGTHLCLPYPLDCLYSMKL